MENHNFFSVFNYFYVSKNCFRFSAKLKISNTSVCSNNHLPQNGTTLTGENCPFALVCLVYAVGELRGTLCKEKNLMLVGL